jgi:hypothetical protein
MSYCVYGGSTPGKRFDADHIVITNNVFQRGPTGQCAAFGPVDAFNPARPGNLWAGNVWEDTKTAVNS